ncbi:DNA/RNA non-specific endonuclease [Hymenobacter sp. UV11]|uniref:DNA/RNA non-specific endonuclease n=1 Tax=Hymenobacter sp. UV11 TaxID=1849735 RepID=UPI0010614D73|nr:DNA/RNA non-specific endonuclease [Hymenobacter sp. UV11]TDN39265.1 DNA/RNA endonuclease [Hymenobacter sp. UV11]TFZ65655.1 DNA/RNA non-specific endonuclease [Hymenobacter sp. UV11]
MKHLLLRRAALATLVLLVTACSKTEDATPTVDTNDNMALGNPSGAVNSTSSPTNYLLTKPQYTVGYNRDAGKPMWVSWHLGAADLGSAPRQDDFRADMDLPTGWYQVKTLDYSGSGFDRGHNCPSADRTATVADNSATFLMSNMMPQAPNNNQQTWGNLEDYCRTLVRAGNELYIICGSYGRGGTGSAGYQTTIAGGKVTVPANCWKVVVVLSVGSNDVGRITSSTRVIAINTPNDNNINSAWGGYRTTINAIEAASGLDLLSVLPLSVQNVVEARIDTGPTN